VSSIGQLAFYGSGLTSVTIPDSVTSVGESAFSWCSRLASVTIGRGVTNLGNGAFSDNSSLAAITVDPLNPSYCSLDGVLFDKSRTTLLQCPGARPGDYRIPETVSTIGDGAFRSCGSLRDVHIPGSVLRVGDSAFRACTSLANVVVPDRVTSIGPAAFAECTSLVGVALPNSLTTVPAYAFYECRSLSGVTIPDRVTEIGSYAFYACTNLTSAVIPDRVVGIGEYGFFGSANLTNVMVGEGVTDLGYMAFSSCSRLREVYFRGNAPGLWSPVFDSGSGAIAYYPPGTTGWKGTLEDLPTAWWVLPRPRILTTPPNFGAQTGGFGFIVAWATNAAVVMEAASDVSTSTWSPLTTNSLTEGWLQFTDPQWTNHPSRFYRVRSP
jgi:hypothetical protein